MARRNLSLGPGPVIGGVHTEGASDGDEVVDEPTLASGG